MHAQQALVSESPQLSTQASPARVGGLISETPPRGPTCQMVSELSENGRQKVSSSHSTVPNLHVRGSVVYDVRFVVGGLGEERGVVGRWGGG